MAEKSERNEFNKKREELAKLIRGALDENKIDQQTNARLRAALDNATDQKALYNVNTLFRSLLPLPDEKKPETDENRGTQTRRPDTF